jgi:hypothetical protein
VGKRMNKHIFPPCSLSRLAAGLTIPSNPAIARLFDHVSQITRDYPSLFRAASLHARTEPLDSIFSKPLIDRRCSHCRAPIPTERTGS